MDGSGKVKEFTADTAQGYMYGSTLCDGKVYYSLHDTPQPSQKETWLEAVINLPTEKPEEGSSSEESSKVEESSSESESSSVQESDTNDVKIHLNDVGTVAKIKEKVYDGNAYEPVVKVTVTINEKKTILTEGADYFIEYKDNDNINAGERAVVVKGIGAYTGEIVEKFTINPKPIKKLKVVAGSIAGVVPKNDLTKLPVYVYDGAKLLKFEKKPDDDYTLEYDESSLKVRVKAKKNSNYTGESSWTKLTVYESGTNVINSTDITLDRISVPYTGKAIQDVEPTVKVAGVELTNGKDYKVQYQNNKDAGTAFVIVTGKGDYKGKAVATFEITAATSSPMKIKEIPKKIYNGKLQKPTVTVTIQKDGKPKKLTKKDYTVIYENNFHAGTAFVTVTGKGNYAGLTKTEPFTIAKQDIKKVSVKGTQGNLTIIYNKRVLKKGRDYETQEVGTASKGKITIQITGMGDFAGEVTKVVKAQ